MGLVEDKRGGRDAQAAARKGGDVPTSAEGLPSLASAETRKEQRPCKVKRCRASPYCSDGESPSDSDALWSKFNMSTITNTKRSRRNRRMSESSVIHLFTSLNEALHDFYEHENQLIKLKVSERALTHKLAEHLQKRFKEYNVDCEYNKIGRDPKRVLNLIEQIKPSEKCDADCDRCTTNNKCVIFPDIIVHRRGKDDNLLVIEAKTEWSKDNQSKDSKKLMALSQSHEFKYKLGVALRFCADLDSTLKSFMFYCQDKSVKGELKDARVCDENLMLMPWETSQQ